MQCGVGLYAVWGESLWECGVGLYRSVEGRGLGEGLGEHFSPSQKCAL